MLKFYSRSKRINCLLTIGFHSLWNKNQTSFIFRIGRLKMAYRYNRHMICSIKFCAISLFYPIVPIPLKMSCSTNETYHS